MLSGACAIDAGSSVIITGGQDTLKRVSGYGILSIVSRYSAQGWGEDLSPLITGRTNHGCASFFKDNTQVQKILTQQLIIHKEFDLDLSCGWRIH